MTKIYFVFFLFLIASENAVCQVYPWVKDTLYGPVKSIADTIDFHAKKRQINDHKPTDWNYSDYLEFNENGILITHTTDERFTNSGCNFDRTFDHHGNLLTEECHTGKHGDLWRYEYDSLFNMTRSCRMPTGGDPTDSVVTVFTYDDSNRKTTALRVIYADVNIRDNYSELIEYAYDTSGNMVKRKTFEADSIDGPLQLTEVKIRQFDAYNNVTAIFYEQTGRTMPDPIRYVYTYDGFGRIIHETWLCEDSLDNHWITIRYNEAGQRIHTTSISYEKDYKSDHPVKRTRVSDYTYDERGNVVTDSHITPGYKSFDEYNYTYDEHGNWIKCVHHSKGLGPRSTTVRWRVITYYE